MDQKQAEAGGATLKELCAATDTLAGERKAMRALRTFCLQCQGEHPSFVRDCMDVACPLHAFRLPESQHIDPLAGRSVRAVRRQCLLCAGDRREVRACGAGESCALWAYRFGVLPSTYKRVTARIKSPKTLWLPGFAPKN